MNAILENPQQPFISRFFQSAIKASQLANTFVLLSTDPIVAVNTVRNMAQVLNCKEAGPTEACGVCQDCLWIQNNAHPAFITLTNWSLDKKKLAKNIAVESFAEVLTDLSRHSGGLKRIVLLVGCAESNTVELDSALWPTPIREQSSKLIPVTLNAEIMSAALSNKLLKTLEEAPRDTYFFLITDAERKLYETILSRSQVLRFRPQDSLKSSEATRTGREVLKKLLSFSGIEGNQAILSDASMVKVRQWLIETAEEEDVSSYQMIENALLQAESFIPEIIRQGPDAFRKFSIQLKAMRQASDQIRQYVREDAVLEYLALDLTSSL